jgi:hypothetical protein
MSEEVRFAAVSTVLNCAKEASLDSLIAALADEESLRVKNRIAVGIAEKRWVVDPDRRESLRAACPPGFALSADGLLSGRPTS